MALRRPWNGRSDSDERPTLTSAGRGPRSARPVRQRQRAPSRTKAKQNSPWITNGGALGWITTSQQHEQQMVGFYFYFILLYPLFFYLLVLGPKGRTMYVGATTTTINKAFFLREKREKRGTTPGWLDCSFSMSASYLKDHIPDRHIRRPSK